MSLNARSRGADDLAALFEAGILKLRIIHAVHLKLCVVRAGLLRLRIAHGGLLGLRIARAGLLRLRISHDCLIRLCALRLRRPLGMAIRIGEIDVLAGATTSTRCCDDDGSDDDDAFDEMSGLR